MWTFFVELAAVEAEEPGVSYPELLFAHGELPADAPTNDFKSPNVSKDDMYGEFEDDFDEEDFDMFDGDDSFEDFGYEDNNWN